MAARKRVRKRIIRRAGAVLCYNGAWAPRGFLFAINQKNIASPLSALAFTVECVPSVSSLHVCCRLAAVQKPLVAARALRIEVLASRKYTRLQVLLAHLLGHGLVGRRHAAETARVVLRLHCVQRRGWHQFILWQHERRTGCTHGHGAQAYTM